MKNIVIRTQVSHEWLFILAIGLLSFNLHASITASDPLLNMIGRAMGVSIAWSDPFSWMPIGFLAIAALFAPFLVKHYPMWKIALLAQILGLSGVIWRSCDGYGGLFGGMIMIGMGLGLAGSLVPGLLKLYFPVNGVIYMGFYSAMIDLGMVMATAVSLPIALAYGSWRIGLGCWAVPLLLGIIVWFVYFMWDASARKNKLLSTQFGAMMKKSIGWQLTVLYAVRVAKSYLFAAWIAVLLQARGYSETDAKFTMALAVLAQIPTSMFSNYLADKIGGSGRLIATCSVFTAVSAWAMFYLPVIWAFPFCLFLSLCTGVVFSRGLGFILERSKDEVSAICLSGLVQGVGFCLGAGGAFFLGSLINPHGEFWIFCTIFSSLTVVSMIFGVICGRPIRV